VYLQPAEKKNTAEKKVFFPESGLFFSFLGLYYLKSEAETTGKDFLWIKNFLNLTTGQ
jgi:hypothetical protein